jgi:hypothetical protein
MGSKQWLHKIHYVKCKLCGGHLNLEGPPILAGTGVMERWFQCCSCGDKWKIRWTDLPKFTFQFADHKAASTSRWKKRRQRPTLFKDVKS